MIFLLRSVMQRAMTEYAGVELCLLVFLNPYCFQISTVVKFIPRSHDVQEKNPPVPIGWETVGLMTLSGGSGEERNLVPFPAGESRFICNLVHLRAATLNTLSLPETLTQTCGVEPSSG
jgi:hypothetical protein